MKISLYNITKEQTLILKAIGILLIVFHNYLHWTNSIGENEMRFDSETIYRFLNFLSINSYGFISAFFSFFGHYGVPLFVFLSAYGLTKQFIKKENVHYYEFIFQRIIKLYSLLIGGLIFLFGIYVFLGWPLLGYLKTVVINMSMLKTLTYRTLFEGVGPWWYFGLALQLYIIFPFLYKFINKYNEKGFYLLLVISVCVIYALLPIGEWLGVPVFGNFIGHMPEFLLGIGFAYFVRFRVTFSLFVLAIFIFVLSWFSEYVFPLGFISVVLLLLVLSYPLLTLSPSNIFYKLLIFIGRISMFIFLLNGPIRYLSLPFFEDKGILFIYLGVIIHLLVTILCSYFMYILYNRFQFVISYNTR